MTEIIFDVTSDSIPEWKATVKRAMYFPQAFASRLCRSQQHGLPPSAPPQIKISVPEIYKALAEKYSRETPSVLGKFCVHSGLMQTIQTDGGSEFEAGFAVMAAYF